MDFSGRYTAGDFTATLPAADYIARFRHAEQIGGYAHTWIAYDYRREPGNGIMTFMTRSGSKIDTF